MAERQISNRRVYTIIAIIFLAIFIIGIVVFGVFRFAKSGGTPSKTYYSYVINGASVPEDSHPSLEPDGKTYILHTELKYKETVTFTANDSAAPAAPTGNILFTGVGISFTFYIEDEKYCLDAVGIQKIMINDPADYYDPGKQTQDYELAIDQYQGEYNNETKTYKVTINHENKWQENIYPYDVKSIELKYAVKNK